jgi:DNA-binding LacI/PurR family transcriptional regulator
MGNKLEDVAKLAGVHPSTVSRAISRPEKVKPETRRKIESIINELGYKPDYFARGLMNGQTDSVGIITSLHTNPYFLEILDSIEHQLSPDGTYIFLCNCEQSADLEEKYIDELVRRKIDALFAVETPSLNTTHNLYINRSFDFPVILINQHTKPFGENYIVNCDQRPGLLAIFDYVKKHDLLPFLLFVPFEKTYSYMIKETLFKKWRRENNLSEKDARIVKLPGRFEVNNEESVWNSHEAVKEFLLSSARPRAILAGNDLMAEGVLTAARKLAIRVPEDLAVAGVDNTFLSRISMPSLSTIDLRMRDVGTLAARLYQKIKKAPKENHAKIHVLPSRLCLRESF